MKIPLYYYFINIVYNHTKIKRTEVKEMREKEWKKSKEVKK